MNILVINCGSSSLKYQLINSETEGVLAKGLCERIGIDGMLTYQPEGGEKEKSEIAMPTHTEAINAVLAALTNEKSGVIKSLSEVGAVGHRVVHGGEKFTSSCLINDESMKAIEECNDLAPLHNPANLIGIRACQELMPGVPMVAVFDTAFHQTMPDVAYTYGIPYEYYEKYKVRRYGFHGTSHSYVSKRTAEIVGKPYDQMKIIVCHLGNGASISAVNCGKSVDTSMGLTPLEGLVMGTRSGDLDPVFSNWRYFSNHRSDTCQYHQTGTWLAAGNGRDSNGGERTSGYLPDTARLNSVQPISGTDKRRDDADYRLFPVSWICHHQHWQGSTAVM